MEDFTAALTRPGQTIEELIREANELLGRIGEECEGLRHKVQVAEERSRQLSHSAEGLERDVIRLQGEVADHSRKRTEIADAVQTYVTDISRFTNELLLKLTKF